MQENLVLNQEIWILSADVILPFIHKNGKISEFLDN